MVAAGLYKIRGGSGPLSNTALQTPPVVHDLHGAMVGREVVQDMRGSEQESGCHEKARAEKVPLVEELHDVTLVVRAGVSLGVHRRLSRAHPFYGKRPTDGSSSPIRIVPAIDRDDRGRLSA